MKRFSMVAIVGTGLIGGSIGLALRKLRLAEKVVGIGRRQASLRVARRVGAVTNTTVDLAKGVAEAELVVVCTPVGQIVEHVREVARHCPQGTLITDVGSTKETIVAALDEGLPRDCRFLGGHPLAGSEKSGAGHAQAELFEGRLAILTPTRNTRAEDFDLLERFWEGLGSVVVQMAAAVPENLFRFSGTGILDSTRLAAGDPVLWGQILTLNRQHVLSALEKYGAELAALHAAIRDEDQAALERLLTIAKKNRDALGS